MIIQLTPDELAKVKKFCDELSPKRLQRDIVNNDTGGHRIIRELTGKVGEYAAWKATGIGQVDFNIYAASQVKHKCMGDLDDHTHVKTCHSKWRGTKYDGWLVGYLESYIDKPADNDRIILTYGDEAGLVDVVGFIYAKEVKGKYRLPVNRRLEHKVALYAEDMGPFMRPLEELK